MTTGVPRPPACWDVVVFTLKKIRLNADADDTTRSAVIGGMMNWVATMVNREIKLDAITARIREMAQVPSVELKEANFNVIIRRDRLILKLCQCTPGCSPSYLDTTYWSWLVSRTLLAL
jgi:hypothetical protein